MARQFVSGSSQRLGVSAAPVAGAALSLFCMWNPVAVAFAQAMVSLKDAGSTQGFNLNQTVGGIIQASTDDGGGTSSAATSLAVTAGVWQPILATYTSTTARAAYLNGGNKGTNAGVRTPGTLTDVWVGALNATTRFANGNIAEVAIWNVDLTDPEAVILAAGVSPLLVRPSALVFYAPLLHGYSPEIDLINGNNLTVTGATIVAHPDINYRGKP